MENVILLCGERPIIVESFEKDKIKILKYGWISKQYEDGNDYIIETMFGRGEIIEIDEISLEKQMEFINNDLKYIEIDCIGKKTSCRRKDGIKERWRVEKKAQNNFAGHSEYLLDIASTDIIFNDIQKVYDCLNEMQAEGNVVRVIDRFKEPMLSGYRDIIVNIRASNMAIMEVKLHIQKIYDLYKMHNEIVENRVDPIIKDSLIRGYLSNNECKEIFELNEKLRNMYSSIIKNA